MYHQYRSRRPRAGELRVVFLLVWTLAIVACGGGGGATTTAGQSATTSPGGGADTSQPATTVVGTTADAGSGGGLAACDLVTEEEVAGVMGIGSVTAESIPGEPSYCTYRDSSNDALVVATSYVSKDAESTYAVWAGSSGVVEVSGLGDGAVFDPSSATLFILKGGAMVGITAGDGSVSTDDRRGLAEQIGSSAVDHM